MKARLWMFAALIALAAGCANEPGGPSGSDTSEPGDLGALTIGLTGTDDNGVQYRLRDGEFLIQKEGGDAGGLIPLQTLSTEQDLNAPYLSARLGRGPYQVTLRGPWYVERAAATGWERVPAVLLSGATQRTYVVGPTNPALLFYRFGIDGQVVDFDTGDLRIEVDFDRPRDAGVRDGGAADAGLDAGPIGGMDGGLDAGADAAAADAGDAGDAGDAADAAGAAA